MKQILVILAREKILSEFSWRERMGSFQRRVLPGSSSRGPTMVTDGSLRGWGQLLSLGTGTAGVPFQCLAPARSSTKGFCCQDALG